MSDALVEDACANAWVILLTKGPVEDERVFGWLCTTARHEAYRLLRLQQRETAHELSGNANPVLVPPGRDQLEEALETRARGRLRALAEEDGGHVSGSEAQATAPVAAGEALASAA